MIIAGWAGIGKTTLAKKYKNVIDIESSPYKWDYSGLTPSDYEKMKGRKDRVSNKNYPINYINAIKDAETKYDVVCVWCHPYNAFPYYEQYGIDYVICYPSKEAIVDYEKRMRDRGNSEEFIAGVMNSFEKRWVEFSNNPHEKIILDKGETLESRLIKMGVKLIEK